MRFSKRCSKRETYRDTTVPQVSSVHLLGRVRLCDSMDCSMPGFLSITNTQSLLKLMSIDSVMSPSPPVFYLSQHQGLFQ